MSLAFFVSSVGDTDLAKAVINKLLAEKTDTPILLIPITTAAQGRTKDLSEVPNVVYRTLAEITQSPEFRKKITNAELEKILSFVKENGIRRAYVGVPSPIDEEIPFQIANALGVEKIPCTIAYEHMFTASPDHPFWRYLPELAAQQTCDFAVPLRGATQDIQKITPAAKVSEVGHLSIDRALAEGKRADLEPIKESLLINEQGELVFISGTTQPTEVDNNFLDALLGEIATEKYPHLQLRFGIHPGVKDIDNYLTTLLETCDKYQKTQAQFKIILTPGLKEKLQNPGLAESPFILPANISGPQCAAAADRVAQAVPGALLNETAVKGKPIYFHEKSAFPYLPPEWFSENIHTFFVAKQNPSPHPLEELGLKGDAPSNLLEVLLKPK